MKENQFAIYDCETSWLFSLSFTCQSLLIFESCIIIENLPNLHLMMLFCSCGSYSVIVNFPGLSPSFTNQSSPILGPFGDHTNYPLQAFNDAITDAHSCL